MKDFLIPRTNNTPAHPTVRPVALTSSVPSSSSVVSKPRTVGDLFANSIGPRDTIQKSLSSVKALPIQTIKLAPKNQEPIVQERSISEVAKNIAIGVAVTLVAPSSFPSMDTINTIRTTDSHRKATEAEIAQRLLDLSINN